VYYQVFFFFLIYLREFMKQLFYTAIFLILPLIPQVVCSQGFSSFNGRNHPYLQWKVAETAHFKIIYPERIAGVESKAAAIAEQSYQVLSLNLDVSFDKKIRVYLTDSDEINNGFAVPVGNGHTNIWVNLNDYIDIWTGREKWMRKVIAHELAHIFHFKAIESNMGLWQFAVADPLPRFFTEGLAQYQTEKWDSQRGDRWLRMAVFDDMLNYNDGRSIYNTRLMYAVGNSQVRYFAEQYGDSTLATLLDARKPFLNFWEVHDFQRAFRKATGDSYNDFEDKWRKHVNVYYNTLASQSERIDSLQADAETLPGTYFFDVKYSPGNSRIAVLSVPSVKRPFRQLLLLDKSENRFSRVLADGNINADISWSADGKKIAYSRLVRSENSSLLNDIFIYDVTRNLEIRVTESRRAISPLFSAGGSSITYIVNESGTGNIFSRDLNTGEEKRITAYSGDVQLHGLVRNETRGELVFVRFDEEGNRNLVVIDESSLSERVIDEGLTDNRMPAVSPDGEKLAFTSLRDEVPNVFIYDFKKETSERVTNLFAGAEVFQWIPETDSLPDRLVIKASETKTGESVFLVDSERRASGIKNEIVPEAYSVWRKQTPEKEIPSSIEADENLILQAYSYDSFKNLTHGASIALPYYAGADYWGIFGSTNWIEPLGKHLVSATGLISFGEFDNSYGILNYVNNQLRPSIIFSAFRMPGEARFYSDRFLIEQLTGGDITISWPLDISERPFRDDRFNIRLRYAETDPFQRRKFSDTFDAPAPVKTDKTELRLGWRTSMMKPGRDNVIHPLEGYGYKLLFTGAEKIGGGDVAYTTLDASAFKILPSVGKQRFYLYGRFQAQFGDPVPQDFIGLSRFEKIEVNLPDEISFIQTNQLDRVRGYRDFVAGNRVAFASIEYRVPFLPSLQTRVLNSIVLGGTSVAIFGDAGVVWNARRADGSRSTEERYGLGVELKNRLNLLGLDIGHAVGLAQKYDELFSGSKYDTYYRVKASVPF